MSEEEESSEISSEKEPISEQIINLEVDKIEEEKEEKEEQKELKKHILELASQLQRLKKNKERIKILDIIGEYSTHREITDILIDIAIEDKYQLCRAKAVSILADLIQEDEVKRTILQTLNDSSQQVRLWSVWALRGIIFDVDVRDVLIRKLKFEEVSNRIKLWIIRSLGDIIDDEEVMYTFTSLLRSKPNTEMKKLLLYYILQKVKNPVISSILSTHIQIETNKEIRREIVKKLLEIDDDDVNYALERLLRREKDTEIVDLIKTKF
jgi:hypothetical protein